MPLVAEADQHGAVSHERRPDLADSIKSRNISDSTRHNKHAMPLLVGVSDISLSTLSDEPCATRCKHYWALFEGLLKCNVPGQSCPLEADDRPVAHHLSFRDVVSGRWREPSCITLLHWWPPQSFWTTDRQHDQCLLLLS